MVDSVPWGRSNFLSLEAKFRISDNSSLVGRFGYGGSNGKSGGGFIGAQTQIGDHVEAQIGVGYNDKSDSLFGVPVGKAMVGFGIVIKR